MCEQKFMTELMNRFSFCLRMLSISASWCIIIISHMEWTILIIINPLHVTVVVLCGCSRLCCPSVVPTESARYFEGFNSWISLKTICLKLWHYLPCNWRGNI